MASKLFPIGGPVTEEDIVDRETFITTLEMRLADGQSIVLVGPRRTGKTSLAHEVLRRLKKREFYTATVDCFRLSNRRDLAQSLINSCLENRTGMRRTLDVLKSHAKALADTAKLAVKLEDLQISVDLFHTDSDEAAVLNYALDLPETIATRDGKNMVVMFDEFQDITQIAGNDIYKKMRSHFQNHRRVSYLFLGSKEGMMKTLFGNRREAFYRFATIFSIPPIPQEAWIEYIARKFADQNVNIEEEAVRQILEITQGHPYNTMLLCSEIYYALLETARSTVTLGIIKAGFDRAMLSLAPIYEVIIEELGHRPVIRQVLRSIAQGAKVYTRKANPNEIKRAIDYLIMKGVIEKTGRGTYRFIEPMFGEYVRRELL